MSGHGGFPLGNYIEKRLSEGDEPTSVATLSSVRGSNFDINFPIKNIITDVVFDDAGGGNRTGPRADGEMQGFRHLLPSEKIVPRFKIFDGPPHKDKPTTIKLRHLMSRLARCMDCEFPWLQHTADAQAKFPKLQKWENPQIPSGYTYLLQLIAHDLVSTSFPISVLEDTMTGARNTRSAALRLDTIYGGGPAACPFAYAFDDANDSSRTALRLGPINNGAGAPPKMRDIARTLAPSSSGAARGGLTEVAIADP